MKGGKTGKVKKELWKQASMRDISGKQRKVEKEKEKYLTSGKKWKLREL